MTQYAPGKELPFPLVLGSYANNENYFEEGGHGAATPFLGLQGPSTQLHIHFQQHEIIRCLDTPHDRPWML